MSFPTTYKNIRDITSISLPVATTDLTDLFENIDVRYYTYTDTLIRPIDITSGITFLNFDANVFVNFYTLSGNYINTALIDDVRTAFYTPFNTVDVNILKAANTVNLTRGAYYITIDYLRNLFGAYNNKLLLLNAISDDRTEVRLKINRSIASPYDPTQRGLRDGSPDRPTRLGTADADEFLSVNQVYEAFKTLMVDNSDGTVVDLNFLLENEIHLRFGPGLEYAFSNIVFRDEYVYLKLINPLPAELSLGANGYIAAKNVNTYVDKVTIVSNPAMNTEFNVLAGPDFNIAVDNRNDVSTNFETYSSLLDTIPSAKNAIINRVLSGSFGEGIDLNIDYTSFANFVHYGSAAERLRVFKGKLEILEFLDSQLARINNASGSDSGSFYSNITRLTDRKERVIGSLDHFERWLYYEPTSSLFTYGITGSMIGQDGYTLQPWPKYLSGSRYYLHHTTSSLGISWYDGYSATASLYDVENDNALLKYTPEYIQLDSNNDDGVLFINMLGHHYDTLWAYTHYVTKQYSHEEHPKLGIPSELLSAVASSFGWQLRHGRIAESLWKYLGGFNASGEYQTTGSLFSKSAQELTYETWQRVVNNLPYILKKKGTGDSIRAILSCYGIPSTLISAREYGGPSVSGDEPALIEERFDYGLYISESSLRYLRTPYSEGTFTGGARAADSIEFRFRPAVTRSMNIIAHESSDRALWGINIEHTASYSGSAKYGRITIAIASGSNLNSFRYISASTNYQPLYNGEYWNLIITTDVPLTGSNAELDAVNANVRVRVQHSSDYIDGKVIHKAETYLPITGARSPVGSAKRNIWTPNTAAYFTSSIIVGGITGAVTPIADNTFHGYIQEYREYMEVISDSVFDYHTLNPTSYRGNNETSSYDTLVRHYPLGTDNIKFDHSVVLSISSSHPNQTITNFSTFASNVTASMVGFTTASYDSFEETYYIPAITIGGNNPRSEKIRLENATLVNTLSPATRGERARYDFASVDSRKFGLFFSPQDQINKEIYNHVAPVNLDNYIGDPNDEFNESYPELKRFALEYWKKYTRRNDLNEYIRIFSIFDLSFFEQIEKVLAARVDYVKGILIEPSILERSKTRVTRLPVVSNPQYDVELRYISASVINAEDVGRINDTMDGLFMRIDRGAYSASIYDFTYLLRSGSTWITSSLPAALTSPSGAVILEARRSSDASTLTRFYTPADDATRFYPLTRFINPLIDTQGTRAHAYNLYAVVAGSATKISQTSADFSFTSYNYNRHVTASLINISSSAATVNGGQMIELPTINLPSVGASGKFSLSFLIKEAAGESGKTRAFLGATGSNSNTLFYNSSDALQFAPGTGVVTLISSANITRDNLNHIAITYNSGSLKCYLNGVLEYEASGNPDTFIINSIGNTAVQSANVIGFSGSFGALRIYDDKELSPGDVSFLQKYPYHRVNRDMNRLDGFIARSTYLRRTAGLYTSSSLTTGPYRDDEIGFNTFNGTQLNGLDFNVPSDDTPDGTPVVTIYTSDDTTDVSARLFTPGGLSLPLAAGGGITDISDVGVFGGAIDDGLGSTTEEPDTFSPL